MAALASGTNYRLGSLYALVTAFLLATQEPFSALAAKRLSSPYFIGLTQFALLLSIPLLTLPAASRRDFIALLSNLKNLGKLAILFVIGLCGLLLYNFGLSGAHPIIVAAILNLSPFWAVFVSLVISRKAIPASPLVFFGCFVVAFAGAMAIAVSQTKGLNGLSAGAMAESFLHRTWIYAIPVPLFFALSGTLVGKWFSDFDESAAIAANFMVSASILIPATLVISYLHPARAHDGENRAAILLLLLGTLAAAAAGRVFYQIALTTTKNDNGFVTMFFLMVPALSSLLSIPLSWWIPDLHFVADPAFFAGLALIAISLFFFSAKSWQASHTQPERAD